jgi:hypothetical protein
MVDRAAIGYVALQLLSSSSAADVEGSTHPTLRGVLARFPGAHDTTRWGCPVASGTRQSRSCGLKEPEGALRVAGVVSVGGCDVVVSVKAEQADREAA